MILGSIAGVAVLYELVQTAHHHQLADRLHSPADTWLAAGALFVVCFFLTMAVPRIVSWFSLFVMIGAFAAGSIAASNDQANFAVPLLGVGLIGGALAVWAWHSNSEVRPTKMA